MPVRSDFQHERALDVESVAVGTAITRGPRTDPYLRPEIAPAWSGAVSGYLPNRNAAISSVLRTSSTPPEMAGLFHVLPLMASNFASSL